MPRPKRLSGVNIPHTRGMFKNGIAEIRYHKSWRYASVPIGFDRPTQPDDYQAGHIFYQDMSTQYDQPKPWFENLHIPRTPHIRFELPVTSQRTQVDYNNGVMTPELMDHAIQELHSREIMDQDHEAASLEYAVQPHQGTLLDDNDDVQINNAVGTPDNLEQIDMAAAITELMIAESGEPAYDTTVENNYPAGLDVGTNTILTEESMPENNPGGLEQIVNEAIPDPFASMTPDGAYGMPEMTQEMFDQATQQEMEQQQVGESMAAVPDMRMQQMYDEQMEMMMNSYQMFGPSGFGPMPGM